MLLGINHRRISVETSSSSGLPVVHNKSNNTILERHNNINKKYKTTTYPSSLLISFSLCCYKNCILLVIGICTIGALLISTIYYYNSVSSSESIVVSYDLNNFIPLNNASTTFTLDQFQLILLQDRVAVVSEEDSTTNDNNVKSRQRRWSVPDINDASTTTKRHIIPASTFYDSDSTTTTTSTVTNHHRHNLCQIICQFDRRSFGIEHFPHFLQQALPCYNIFHYFAVTTTSSKRPRPLRNYMIVRRNITSSSYFSKYIQDFIKLMEGSPYFVNVLYGYDPIVPVHDDCNVVDEDEEDNGVIASSSSSSSSSSSTKNALWLIKSFSNTGWDRPNQYFLSVPEQQSPKYDNFELIQQIQQSILGDDNFYNGPSSLLEWNDVSKTTNSLLSSRQKQSQQRSKQLQYRIIQILILDRKYASRDFSHVHAITHVLQNYIYNTNYTTSTNTATATTNTRIQFRFNVTYIPSFNHYTLFQQAYTMHHYADIIYSPHGAQLSNTLYIRPCTICVEFFPRAYYMQFFQSLVVNTHGISYEGYPTPITYNESDKVTASSITAQDKYLRDMTRNSRIDVGPDFFIQSLPRLIETMIQCRMNYV